MSEALVQPAASLADLLALENEALRRMDLATAASLLPAKQAAVAAFAASAVSLAGTSPTPPVAALGQRLTALAMDNRALLERAITVQTRIVGIIAHAARPPAPHFYGAKGQQAPKRRAAAVALRTTA